VELRVLGELEVWHDGAPLSLRAAKPRQLLTLLATRPNEPIPAGVLIDELWEGGCPPTAASALRVHVTQVRRALEPNPTPGPSIRLPLCPSGYVLRVAVEELDSARFESLVVGAREANALGDPARAETQLTTALGLWRGTPLADAQGLSAIAGKLARLNELRISALEELAEAKLVIGQHAALVDLMRDAVKEFPLHETFAARLMLALYRSGRQSDALRAFGNLAHQLDLQLGIEPSTSLRQLEEDILLQRSHLDYSRRCSDVMADGQSRFPPRLIGRRDELRQLLEAEERAANGDRCFVLLSGPAGIGKTTLASEFCARAQSIGASVFRGVCVNGSVSGYEAVTEILAAISCDSDHGPVIETALSKESQNDGPKQEQEVFASRDLESEQLHLFESIAGSIRTIIDRPVVVLVEDLQWAGPTTLLVLRHLMRLADLDTLLLVVTVQDEELDVAQSELIEGIAPAARRQVLHLEGLNDHEVRSLKTFR
jgi:DNA-binding SARP family transcriptional activator